MKNTKKRALYIVAALLAALFVLSCLIGFAACGGGSTEDDDKKDTPTEQTATVSSVSISPSSLSLKMGGTTTGSLTATVKMSDGTNSSSQTVNWTSSDTSVATVSATGYTATVTALKAGTTSITASVGSVTSTACTVTVAKADESTTEPEPTPDPDPTPAPTVSSVVLSQSSLVFEYGGSATTSDLTATVTMSDDSEYDGDYTWTSSDDSVASISGTGSTVAVTAGKCGETAITVSVGEDDNVETATCSVTVSEDHVAAEEGRITGSAEAAEGFNFTFDDAEAVEAGTAVLFNDSSVSATYDTSSKTYTLSGLSVMMSSDQSEAFWGETDAEEHMGHRYIGFIVNVNAGESIGVTTYTGEDDTTKEKDVTFTSSDEDTSFILDLEDHDTDGDWRMVLDVTYAGGDEETYTVVIGDVETGVACDETLRAAVAGGADSAVVMADDITLSTKGTDGSSYPYKDSSSLFIGNATGDVVKLTIDLNGKTLSCNNTDSSNRQYFSTIIVRATGDLTIIDSAGGGVVDASVRATAALANYGGTVTLAGGTFLRSGEDGFEEAGSYKESDSNYNYTNSDYTIYNQGTMTIEDGATVFNAGDYSTCIRNKGESADKPAKLTINGGKVYGGKYAVGTGDSGLEDEFVMTGGQLGGLRSETDYLPYRALNNYCNATITGGKLLGGNGGAIDVGGKPDACVEGVVIFNEDTATQALTIGDEEGNGPEIIYEGINPNAATNDGGQTEETGMSYYTEPATEEEAELEFATGIALYSGEVDILGGTIECSDASEDRDYNFMGVYLTDGTLRVSGGKISGDEAILIDLTAKEDRNISISITGGELVGGIYVHDSEEEEDVDSVYDPGKVDAPHDGDDDFSATVKDENGNDVTVTFTDCEITIFYDPDSHTYTIEGVSAKYSADQLAALELDGEDDDHTGCWYVSFKVTANAGETIVITTYNGETLENTWYLYGEGVEDESTTDGAFVLDTTNHTCGDWRMELKVTYANGTEVTYTIVLGEIQTFCEAYGHTWDDGVVTEATCTQDGCTIYTCTVCGETTTEAIPATGHTAKEYDDGNMYAVYKNLAGVEEAANDADADNYAWCAYCETCEEWFEIGGDYGDYCIYEFVLVAKDEASLNAAISVAGKNEDASEEDRTQILVYGTINISDDSYVLIDCSNVEIYGLGADKSKIIDSKYESKHGSGTAEDGVEITGSNVTIRDLTIDGSRLDEIGTHNTYEHGLEILEYASNVTLLNCVIIGGTSDKSSAVVLMGGQETGYVLIENCTLSGYHGITIEHDGSTLDVTISGGKIDGVVRAILIDAGNGIYLNVVDAEIYGKISLTTNTSSATFSNCTLGYSHGDSGSTVYGSVSAYCDVTFEKCKFLSNSITGATIGDGNVKSSNNYVIKASVVDITITLIDCEFENTYTDTELSTGTRDVTADTFIYLVGSSSNNLYLYFDGSEGAMEYLYDKTEYTVAHIHELVGTYADGTWTYTCSTCEEEVTLEESTLVKSLTLEVDDATSLTAAATWNEIQDMALTIHVVTTDANHGTITVTGNFGLRYGEKTMLLDADIDMGSSYTIIVLTNVVLDLNGHSITRTNDSSLTTGVIQVGQYHGGNQIYEYGDLTVMDSSEDQTGKISGSYGVTVYGGDNTDGYVSSLTLVSGTIEGSKIAISTNGSTEWGAETINIQGGTVKGTGETSFGIYLPGGELNVTGGTISGVTGIEIKAGTVSITGGTISTTVENGTTNVEKKSGSTDTYGYAIGIIDGTSENANEEKGYKALTSVSISGCELTGDIYVDASVESVVTVDASLGLTKTPVYVVEDGQSTEEVDHYIYTAAV